MSNPRKPSALKLVEGTYRKDRAAKNEPKPEITSPSTPAHLSASAKAEWRRITKELVTLGLLSRIDRSALEMYCEAYADWKEAKKLCETKGGEYRKVVKGANGDLKKNPMFTVMTESSIRCHRLLAEFGMSPASRSRINTLVDAPPESGKQEKQNKNWA